MTDLSDKVTYRFIDSLPEGFNGTVCLVSDEGTLRNYFVAYCVVEFEDGTPMPVFEIRYEYKGFSRPQIQLNETVIAIGYMEHFYVYNYVTRVNVLVKKLGGYFSDMLYADEAFYVADWDTVYKFNQAGDMLWKSSASIAHDGIHLQRAECGKLYGNGCFNPEDAEWCDFVLDTAKGRLLEEGEA